MILRSVEEGISFKIEVFPMVQPAKTDFERVYGGRGLESFDEYLEEHGPGATFLFVQITALLEPIVAGPGQYVSSPTLDEDPEMWQNSPLHHEVLETIKVGKQEFLFVAGDRMWIVTGEWSVDVEEEKA